MLTASRVDDPKAWLEQHAINEVECLVPDLNGILRGKVMPAAKVLASLEGARYVPADKRLHHRRHWPLHRNAAR